MSPSIPRRPLPAALAAALIAAALLSGCLPSLRADWLEAGAYRMSPPEEDYDGAGAVVLKRRDTYLLVNNKGGQLYFEQQRHDVVKILTEKGLGYATIKFSIPGRMKLTHLSARTLQPDGSFQELDRADLIEDESRALKEKTKDVAARVPGVRVGSVVEYIWTLRQEQGPAVVSRVIADDVPVLDYELDFRVKGEIDFDARSYNTGKALRLVREVGGYRVVLALKDVPARKQEAYRPHGSLNDPWWIFGVRTYIFGYREENVVKTWDSALTWIARAAYFDRDKYHDGLQVDVDMKGCQQRRCAAERALDFVHSRTDYVGSRSSISSARQLKLALESGSANNWEKAMLYREALTSVGVESFLTVSTRYLDKGFDASFPTDHWFDHVVVYIPAQDDISAPLFVDPSCEYCRVGEVPWWSRDCAAIVLRPYRRLDARFTADTEHVTVRGRAPRRAVTRTEIDVVLDEQGGLTGSVLQTRHGTVAKSSFQEWRGYKRQDFEKMAERDLRKRVASGDMLNLVPGECDKRQARCSYGYELATTDFAFSTSDKDVQVSLNLLHAQADSWLQEDDRQHDIVVRFEEDQIERVRFRLPEGYTVKSLPPPVKLESAAFEYELLSGREPGGFFVERRFSDKRGQHPRAAYDELRKPLLKFADVTSLIVSLERAPSATPEVSLEAQAP